MKEFIDKLISRLEYLRKDKYVLAPTVCYVLEDVKRFVNQLAEEYKTSFMDELLEAKRNCGEDSDCSECPFGQIEDRCVLQELQTERENNGWIPCSERLPEAGTCRDVWITLEDAYKAKWYLDHFEWENGIVIKGPVIAWMPYDVPAPYQPKGE